MVAFHNAGLVLPFPAVSINNPVWNCHAPPPPQDTHYNVINDAPSVNQQQEQRGFAGLAESTFGVLPVDPTTLLLKCDSLKCTPEQPNAI